MSSRDRDDPSAGHDVPSPSLATDTAAIRTKTSPSPAPSIKLADPELPLPSPQQTNAEDADDRDHDEDPGEDEQRQDKPFEPLFTLVTNTTANTTAHPRVHYLFSDDDAASILAAHNPASPSDRALLIDLVQAPAASPPGDDTTNPSPAAPLSNRPDGFTWKTH
jgi:hypothetical protein